eukprot:CAMPEP_0119155224 /NCGR_PEP_ID=MMETSP1310-20130426/51633_1 /TAXON_ID=464262 /ORGANISM="Genus nov. species nov., Strain RCC2339" /LENGTH=290 /DNA_ID=CAMNT_0007147813 /DNA_START=260 /DNA_END=1133 /DNA_ORIENTATION=+
MVLVCHRVGLDAYVRALLSSLRGQGFQLVLVTDSWCLPPAKWLELGKRRKQREGALFEMKELKSKIAGGGSESELAEWSRKYQSKLRVAGSGRLERDERALSESCLSTMTGIRHVRSPGEADAQLADLYHNGSVDIVWGNDTDITFIYGVKELLEEIDLKNCTGTLSSLDPSTSSLCQKAMLVDSVEQNKEGGDMDEGAGAGVGVGAGQKAMLVDSVEQSKAGRRHGRGRGRRRGRGRGGGHIGDQAENATEGGETILPVGATVAALPIEQRAQLAIIVGCDYSGGGARG